MFKDTSLQIFLTIYHGSLMGTFFYDYIIRNTVRLYENGLDWSYISNIGMGALFILIIIWAILSVWRKIPRNLLICLIALIIMLIVRLGVGIPDNMEKSRKLPYKTYAEELSVFIAAMAVHFFGIVATWILFSKTPSVSLPI